MLSKADTQCITTRATDFWFDTEEVFLEVSRRGRICIYLFLYIYLLWNKGNLINLQSRCEDAPPWARLALTVQLAAEAQTLKGFPMLHDLAAGAVDSLAEILERGPPPVATFSSPGPNSPSPETLRDECSATAGPQDTAVLPPGAGPDQKKSRPCLSVLIRVVRSLYSPHMGHHRGRLNSLHVDL